MAVIAVANQKGGPGKTIISTMLAKYIGGQGKTVEFYGMVTGDDGKRTKAVTWKKKLPNKKALFLEYDPQGNAKRLLNDDFTGTYAHDLLTRNNVEILPSKSGVTYVPGDKRLTDLHNSDPTEIAGNLKVNLARYREHFDHVIIDTPPTENIIIRCIFTQSRWVLAPVIPVTFSMDGLGSMLQLVYGIKANYNHELDFLGMVPNQIMGKISSINLNDDQKGMKKHESALKALLKSPFGHLVLLDKNKKAVGISYRGVVEDAIIAGKPVWELKGADALASTQEFVHVFEAIAHRIGGF